MAPEAVPERSGLPSGPGIGRSIFPASLGDGVRGFFTSRAGGLSAPPFDSLNLGGSVGDQPDAVMRNRALVSDWLGRPVRFANQVHSANVLPPGCADGDGDALLGTKDGVGVLVADCVPILLRGDGLVAAVHAGRKGLLAGVVEATLEAMSKRGQPAVHAAIGPSICGECYEVPEQMHQAATAIRPAVASTTRWGTPALDLPAGVAAILKGAVKSYHQYPWCTYEDDRFYSYRRDGDRTGRFAAVVACVDPAWPELE